MDYNTALTIDFLLNDIAKFFDQDDGSHDYLNRVGDYSLLKPTDINWSLVAEALADVIDVFDPENREAMLSRSQDAASMFIAQKQ